MDADGSQQRRLTDTPDQDESVTAWSPDGEEIAYVIEGMLEYQFEGKPPVTLKAGEALFIPAGTIHSAKNVGNGNGAELATYLVEKGKPLVAFGPVSASVK